jgi:uncharacterized protein (DUF58 family)
VSERAARAGERSAPADPPALLEPALLTRLERLQLRTPRPLAGRFAGEHRSRRHGTSLDFADYREYHPGDDFRRIDYHLWARLDVLLLKLFEADDDLTLRLLIDTSASMAGPKLHQARRVAAALGFVSLVRRDAVTVHTFPASGPAPRFTGRAAATPLFDHLLALRAAGGTGIAAACADVLARRGPPGITVVVSDLLTDEWEAGLGRLPARGAHVVVVHVLDPEELRPTMIGDYDLIDRETGSRVPVSLSPVTLAAYERRAAAWADTIARRCRERGAAYVRLLSDEDLGTRLLGSWRDEGLLR